MKFIEQVPSEEDKDFYLEVSHKQEQQETHTFKAFDIKVKESNTGNRRRENSVSTNDVSQFSLDKKQLPKSKFGFNLTSNEQLSDFLESEY